MIEKGIIMEINLINLETTLSPSSERTPIVDNISSESTDTFCKETWCILEIILLTTLSVIITFGNGFNIAVIRSTSYLRNIHGCLLISLSIADIGLGPITAIAASTAIMGKQWYGAMFCHIIAYLGELFRYVSLAMLTALSVNKYIAILHPLRYSAVVTKRRTVSVILGVWCILALFYFFLPCLSTPRLMTFNNYSHDLYICVPSYNGANLFLRVMLTVGLLTLSFVIMTYTSIRVMTKILKSTKRRRRLFADYPKRKTSKFGRLLPFYLRSNMKAFRILIVIAGMFYLTWLPFTVRNTLSLVKGDDYITSHACEFITFWLSVANSCCNIAVYYIMDEKYRATLKTLLRKMFMKENFQLPVGNVKTMAKLKLAGQTLNVPRPTYYYIGIRNEDGSIVATDVKVTGPPLFRKGRSFSQCVFNDENFRKQNFRPKLLPFYSVPNGVPLNF